jgi:predicted enzyme related to lactoylglutathione lyase
MSITNALASVAVNDIHAAIQWYEMLFGRRPDSTPMPELAEWKFEDGGGLQVYELRERAGSCSCTLVLSNLDEEVSRIGQLGIDTSKRTTSTHIKTMMINDPDGNTIAFAEAKSPAFMR